MTFQTFKQVAVSLEKFNKARTAVYIVAVRTVARDIAKKAKTEAAGYHVVQKIRKHNRNIKVMIIPSAYLSKREGTVVGLVRATGLIAKIEKGMNARRFWNNRGGTVRYKGWAKKKTAGEGLRSAIFKSPSGWKTIHKKAGGQKYKKRTFIKITPTQQQALATAIDRVNALASSEHF